jgi:hypothetical protein
MVTACWSQAIARPNLELFSRMQPHHHISLSFGFPRNTVSWRSQPGCAVKLEEGRTKMRVNNGCQWETALLIPQCGKAASRHNRAAQPQRQRFDSLSLCFHLDFTRSLFSYNKLQSINGVSYSVGAVTPIDHVYSLAWSRRGPIQYERLTSFFTLLISISNRVTTSVSS